MVKVLKPVTKFTDDVGEVTELEFQYEETGTNSTISEVLKTFKPLAEALGLTDEQRYPISRRLIDYVNASYSPDAFEVGVYDIYFDNSKDGKRHTINIKAVKAYNKGGDNE